MKKEFSGLWPAMFTPVDDSGEPALDQLEKLVELFISQDLDGLYILGSTGQGVLFTEEQRKRVTKVVTQVSSNRIPIIVQVGALTTDESVRLAKHAESCGVDGISSVGPIYFPGTVDMALEHYRRIASATNLPFFPYQLGDNSIPGGIPEFVKRVLEIPNIAGMKLTTNQLLDISSIHNNAGEKLRLFSGSDELFCHASLCGTVGAIGTTYNIWGVECKRIMQEFRSGNFVLAKEFMLNYHEQIRLLIPNGWTFFRQAMLLKYNIDIGPTKAPLGNTNTVWKDKDVLKVMDKVEAITVSKKGNI